MHRKRSPLTHTTNRTSPHGAKKTQKTNVKQQPRNTYLRSMKGDAKGFIKKKQRQWTRKSPPKQTVQWMLSGPQDPLQEGRPYSSRLWLPSSLLKLLGSSEQKREASSRTTTPSPGSQWQVTPQWAVLRARLSRPSWASQNCHAIFSLAAASVENTSQCNFFVQFCILSFHKCWSQEPSLIKVSSLVFRGTHPT